jgi:integrase
MKKGRTTRRRTTETIAYLTQDEMRRLLGVIESKRDKALFLTAYRHGLRASEIGLLQRTDVDFKRLRLRVHRVKGSISAEYPMQPDLAKALRSYIRSRKDDSPYLFPSRRHLLIDRTTLHKLMRRYGQQAKLPPEKQHFHCLKHSIATHLLDAGADLAFVQDWLGHANIQNTRIYAQLTNPRREEQARKVFASPRVV